MKRSIRMYLLYISLIALFTFVIVGMAVSYRIRLVEHDVAADIPLSIGHLSDIHIKNYTKAERFASAIAELNDLKPDIVVFTGDLFDTDQVDESHVAVAIEILGGIECAHKFAVLGNHDYDTLDKLDYVRQVLDETGFVLLVNEDIAITIADQSYHIIGLDDYRSGDASYDDILATTAEHDTNIVLSHEPDTFETVREYAVALMLSGHSHGGQVRIPAFGGIYNVPGAKVYRARQTVEQDHLLLVSFGLGESLIPIRMYNPRQVEFYRCS